MEKDGKRYEKIKKDRKRCGADIVLVQFGLELPENRLVQVPIRFCVSQVGWRKLYLKSALAHSVCPSAFSLFSQLKTCSAVLFAVEFYFSVSTLRLRNLRHSLTTLTPYGSGAKLPKPASNVSSAARYWRVSVYSEHPTH